MENIIIDTVRVLKKGGTILYPTDTIWGIGCDATSNKAVDKVFRIKGRKLQKSFIVLLDSAEKLEQYSDGVSPVAYDLIEQYTRPLTIIYPRAKKLAKHVIASDGTIAIRIVKNDFCRELIRAFGKPIVSTSANFSGTPNPSIFRDIDPLIKESVDYVVPLYQDEIHKVNPSTIIQLLDNGSFKIIRD